MDPLVAVVFGIFSSAPPTSRLVVRYRKDETYPTLQTLLSAIETFGVSPTASSTYSDSYSVSFSNSNLPALENVLEDLTLQAHLMSVYVQN